MTTVRYDHSPDFSHNEVRNARLQSVDGLPPASPDLQGWIVRNEADGRVYVCTGTRWELEATNADRLGGQLPAYYLQRANHTGQQPAESISGLNAAIATQVTAHEGKTDPHPQYLTEPEGNARYLTPEALAGKENVGTAASAVAAHEAKADPHPQYLTEPEGNARYVSAEALAGKENVGTAASAVAAHEGKVDPHPQYLNQTEGDARYAQGTDPRLSDARPPTQHTHPRSDVAGLDTALAGKEAAGTAASAVAAHEGKVDPHPQYLQQGEADDRYLTVTTRGQASGVASLDAGAKVPAGQIPFGSTTGTVAQGNDPRLSDARTPTAHSHPTSDVTGLGTALAGKADLVGGKVPQGQIPAVAMTDYLGGVASQAAMLALVGQRGDWATRTDLGTDWQLTADDPTLLASWREMTYPPSPVSSVAGRTGAVVLSTTDVTGLDTALAGKEATGVAAQTVTAHEAKPDPHPQYLNQTEGDGRYALGTDPRLSDARTPTAHSHPTSDVTGLDTALAGKEATGVAAQTVTAHEQATNPHPQYTADTAAALRHKLAANQRCVWAHLGDSTANGTDEWLYRALGAFAADYPNIRVEHRLWNDANQSFDAATLVQAGNGGTAPDPIVRDTFTRTAAALSGTAADTGQVWGSGNGALDGAVYTIGNVAASIVHNIDPNGTDGLVVQGRFTIPSGTTSGNVRLFALAYNGTDELFAEIGPSATGLGLNLYQRVGGTATPIGSAASIALANTADRIADLSLSFKAGQATATLTANGTTVTRSAAVTVPGNWAGYASGRNLSITGPAGFKADEVSAGLNAPDPASLVVYNGSMPGASLAYHQARTAAMLPEAPDLVTIASSHNHGTQSVTDFLGQVDALVSAVLALRPDASIALVSQNPQFSPANSAAVRAAHNARIVAVGPHARARGFGYIPAAERFLTRTDRGQGVVVADGIHPDPAGSALWRDAALTYLRGQAQETGRGPTASRPSAVTAGDGAMYYDTDIDKPIWSDGTAWRVAVDDSDARLSNARPPTAHAHPQADVTGLTAALADKVDTADARLSNARPPTAHKTSHAAGGSDVLSPADIGAVAKSGDTMTGALALNGVPTENNHAAHKAYVDSQDGARLALTGGTMTGGLGVPDYNSVRVTGLVNKFFSNNDAYVFAQAPFAPMWHDVLAFNRHFGVPKYETSADGTTFTVAPVDNRLFSLKESQNIPVLNGTTTKAARWTWFGSQVNWSGVSWLVIGHAYVATPSNKTILVETSADDVVWTTRHVSSANSNQQPVWYFLNSWGADTQVRVTITWNSGGGIQLTSMRMLTTRWGSQGAGREIEFPYTWDETGRMQHPDPVGAQDTATKAYADTKVPSSRQVSSGTGLAGGGDLTQTRTLSVVYGTTAGTSAQGNDPRLSDARTPTAHSHPTSDVTGLGTALAGKADLVDGKVPQGQIPAVAMTDYLGGVASQAAMLALVGQRGDWATRTDLGTDWQLIADDPTLLASWREMTYPASPVSSVAGRTGAVVLSTTDVTGLDTALADKETAGTAASAVAAHEAKTDPHPQYLNQTEGDARYAQGTDPRLSDARTPKAHSHPTSDVTGLDTALAGKEAAGTAASAVAAHEAATDPHPQYLQQTEGDARYALGTDPRLSDARTPTAHIHAQADITNLSGDLAARQLTSERNQPGGYAGLDANSKLAGAQQLYSATGTIVAVGNAAAAGTSNSAARGDHTHPGVALTGDQTIAGIKTFSSSPVVPAPTAANQAASKAYVDALDARLDLMAGSDRRRYGDVISSVPRRMATAFDEYTTGYCTYSCTISPVAATVSKLRFYVTAGGTAGTGPTSWAAIYVGTDPAALALRAQVAGQNEMYTVGGLRSPTLDAPVTIAPGDYVAYLIGVTNHTVSPRLSTTVGAPATLVNNDFDGIIYEGYRTHLGTLPSTLDIRSSSPWNFASATPWWALL